MRLGRHTPEFGTIVRWELFDQVSDQEAIEAARVMADISRGAIAAYSAGDKDRVRFSARPALSSLFKARHTSEDMGRCDNPQHLLDRLQANTARGLGISVKKRGSSLEKAVVVELDPLAITRADFESARTIAVADSAIFASERYASPEFIVGSLIEAPEKLKAIIATMRPQVEPAQNKSEALNLEALRQPI